MLLKMSGSQPSVNWEALAALVPNGTETADQESNEEENTAWGSLGDIGARMVRRRLLQTSEGATLRRILYEVDIVQAVTEFFTSTATRPLRRAAAAALAQSWSS